MSPDTAPILRVGEFQECKWLFKLRGDLLYLRGRPFANPVNRRVCVICSGEHIEDTYHFIGKCKALVLVRRTFLGCDELQRDAYLAMLETGDRRLFRYCRVAWDLRYRTIKEYDL